jgi:endonuclease/exonuclease/phosphatase family metal-dependent hydrolase
MNFIYKYRFCRILLKKIWRERSSWDFFAGGKVPSGNGEGDEMKPIVAVSSTLLTVVAITRPIYAFLSSKPTAEFIGYQQVSLMRKPPTFCYSSSSSLRICASCRPRSKFGSSAVNQPSFQRFSPVSILHEQYLYYRTYSITPLSSTKSKEDECMLTLPPDNFSRYSKYLVRNSNGVDGMGGDVNTIQTEKEELSWVDKLGESCHTNPNQFSLLSWNILAQSLYEPHCKAIGTDHHPWSKRLQRITQILSHADSDIVCLQECELHSFQHDLVPILSSLGYDGVAQEDERSDSEKPTPIKEITKHRDARNHITATFWKRDKFEPVGESYVRTRSMTNVLRLKNTASSQEAYMPTVAVVNCHLEGHPKRFSERTHQLQHALADLAKMMMEKDTNDSGNHRLNALVIAGDFNCELQSSACSAYLRIGRLGRQAGLGGVHGEDSLVIPPSLLETNEATEILHPIVEWGRALPEEKVSDVSPHPFRRNGMVSAYPVWLGKENAKEHFTYIGAMNKRPVPGLDQIWYSSMTMKRVALKRPIVDFLGEWGTNRDVIDQRRDQERLKMLSTGLPDPLCTYPSDHLPIGCIFDWQYENDSIRNLTVLDTEGNIVDFSNNATTAQESLEFEEMIFETPMEELDYLILNCPYDSEEQRSAVEFILSPIEPPLCTETKKKPTSVQLKQIDERRDVKAEVLASSSLGVRPWLKRIWKAQRQVGAYERNLERLKKQ